MKKKSYLLLLCVAILSINSCHSIEPKATSSSQSLITDDKDEIFSLDYWQALFKTLINELKMDVSHKVVDELFKGFKDEASDPQNEELSFVDEHLGFISVVDLERLYYRGQNNDLYVSINIIPNTSKIVVSQNIYKGENTGSSISFFQCDKTEKMITKIHNEQLIQELDLSDFIGKDFPKEFKDNVYLSYRAYIDIIIVDLAYCHIETEDCEKLFPYVNYVNRELVWNGDKYEYLDVNIDTPTKKSFKSFCKNYLNYSDEDILDFFNGKLTKFSKLENNWFTANFMNDMYLGFDLYEVEGLLEVFGDAWVYLKTKKDKDMCVYMYSYLDDFPREEKYLQTIRMFEYDAKNESVSEIDSTNLFLPKISADDFYYLDRLDQKTKDFVANNLSFNYNFIPETNEDSYLMITCYYPYELADENLSQNLSTSVKVYEIYYRWDGEKFVQFEDF